MSEHQQKFVELAKKREELAKQMADFALRGKQ